MSTSSEQEIPSASLLLVLSRFVSSIFNIDWAADVMVHVGVCYQELTVLRAFAVIAYIPYLDQLASLLVKFLVFVLPASILRSVVSLVMKFPPDSAVDTTLFFLKSKSGVRQAVYVSIPSIPGFQPP